MPIDSSGNPLAARARKPGRGGDSSPLPWMGCQDQVVSMPDWAGPALASSFLPSCSRLPGLLLGSTSGQSCHLTACHVHAHTQISLQTQTHTGTYSTIADGPTQMCAHMHTTETHTWIPRPTDPNGQALTELRSGDTHTDTHAHLYLQPFALNTAS